MKPLTPRKNIFLSLLAAALTVAAGLVAQNASTEAPAAFATTPLSANLTPSSVSNGIAEPAGDTYLRDQAVFEEVHDTTNGLGPVFNGTSCAQCHQNAVDGSASQFTELRVGHLDSSGNFVNPTVPINDGMNSITGRSIVNDRAICDTAQEHVPSTETIQGRRAVLNTLGDGFVEAVPDQTLLAIAASQPTQTNGLIHGEAIVIPILESPGNTMVGRFGWKDQQPTVLSFVGDAYLNEMGVTNRLRRRMSQPCVRRPPIRRMYLTASASRTSIISPSSYAAHRLRPATPYSRQPQTPKPEASFSPRSGAASAMCRASLPRRREQ